MTRQRLVLNLASAARRQSQNCRDVAALNTQTCNKWALVAARHISWPATADGQAHIEVTLPVCALRIICILCAARTLNMKGHGREVPGSRTSCSATLSIAS